MENNYEKFDLIKFIEKYDEKRRFIKCVNDDDLCDLEDFFETIGYPWKHSSPELDFPVLVCIDDENHLSSIPKDEIEIDENDVVFPYEQFLEEII